VLCGLFNDEFVAALVRLVPARLPLSHSLWWVQVIVIASIEAATAVAVLSVSIYFEN